MPKTCCPAITTDNKTLFWKNNCLTTDGTPKSPELFPCCPVYYDSTKFQILDGVLTSINFTKVKPNNSINLCGGFRLDKACFQIVNNICQCITNIKDDGSILEDIDGVITDIQKDTVLTGEPTRSREVARFIFDHGVAPYIQSSIVWNNDYEGRSNSDGYFNMNILEDDDDNCYGATISLAGVVPPNQDYKLGVSIKDSKGVVGAYQVSVTLDLDPVPSITAVTNPPDINLSVGEEIPFLGVTPSTVEVTLSNGTTKNASVTWSDTISTETANSGTLTGTIHTHRDYSNPENLTATIEFSVTQSEPDDTTEGDTSVV